MKNFNKLFIESCNYDWKWNECSFWKNELSLFCFTNLHSSFLYQQFHNLKRNVNHVNIIAIIKACFRCQTQKGRHQQSSLLIFFLFCVLFNAIQKNPKNKNKNTKDRQTSVVKRLFKNLVIFCCSYILFSKLTVKQVSVGQQLIYFII